MITRNTKISLVIVSILVILFVVFGVYQVLMLKRVHSSFENYYAFRGCQTLVSRTDEAGVCRTRSGATIKIVKFDDRWFLDGDLPCGFLCF